MVSKVLASTGAGRAGLAASSLAISRRPSSCSVSLIARVLGHVPCDKAREPIGSLG